MAPLVWGRMPLDECYEDITPIEIASELARMTNRIVYRLSRFPHLQTRC